MPRTLPTLSIIEKDFHASPLPSPSLDIFRGSPSGLPFGPDDVTAGAENELQVVVQGRRQEVDLPLTIEKSNYFANILRSTQAGETSPRLVTDLERYLAANREEIWENSWVRFPRKLLSLFADSVLRRDLLGDKSNPSSGLRGDLDRFLLPGESGDILRVPVSYLVKLALADVVGSQHALPPEIRETGVKLMDHYLNDNTSPETFSFHVVPLRAEDGMGQALARETGRRFLLTHLLTQYANDRFGLRESGQRARIYFAPHPPVRQKELNDLIADGFYRELFMSPCLSGWDQGEKKHRYMHLCHQVLSRSQLNGVAKLREAGIVTNNLVVLPTLSNVSLANNGTHISLGSRRLSALRAGGSPEFDGAREKQSGDLAIKIVEHFLPLFVGTYSAAPYRLGFMDFHPEKALGFLPHELDTTHLRMFWRRWKKKASLSFFGRSLTPFGPPPLDRSLAALFGLRGDFVPDFRLLDYPVALLSTLQSPALDGRAGNQEKLKRDLSDLGIFDPQMSVYLPYRQREFAAMGFSGFEGRHYSLFEDLEMDMGQATDLQVLVTALAFKYMAEGTVTHGHIPDHPTLESERRQIFFGVAIGLPTFFVHRETRNLLLKKILAKVGRVRPSRRYTGYLRVGNLEYRRALLEILREDAPDLVEALRLGPLLEDLSLRLEYPEERSASGRLTRGILESIGASSPLKVPAREFNLAAETFYRESLRKRHLETGLVHLEQDLRRLDRSAAAGDARVRNALSRITGGVSPDVLLSKVRSDLLREEIPLRELRQIIDLTLLTVHQDTVRASQLLRKEPDNDDHTPSIRRAG